jgi:hypothetical protein
MSPQPDSDSRVPLIHKEPQGFHESAGVIGNSNHQMKTSTVNFKMKFLRETSTLASQAPILPFDSGKYRLFFGNLFGRSPAFFFFLFELKKFSPQVVCAHGPY